MNLFTINIEKQIIYIFAIMIVLNVIPAIFIESDYQRNYLYAQDENSEEEDEDWGDEEEELFVFSGMVELENFFNTYTEQDMKDVNKKNEVRNRLKMKFGTEYIYLNSVTNIYFLPTFINSEFYNDYRYSEGNSFSRNLQLSSEGAEASFNELYFNYSFETVRLRLGNQIYAWGTADVFNPTSYFNPSDMREVLFKSEDEMKYGVPSLSGMIFLGDFTLELIYLPMHIPGGFSPAGNFWSMDMDDDLYSIRFAENNGMDIDWKNFAYGAKFSASISGFDFSLSGYHGPDKDFVTRPARVVIEANQKPIIEVVPENFIVDYIGFDFATTVSKFAFQAEAVYSPDKTGLVEQDVNSIENPNDLILPYEVKQSHYISYGIGANYFIPLNRLIKDHAGDTVLAFEWSQSMYFDDEISAPLLSGIIAGRLQDSFIDGKLKIDLRDLYDVMKGGNRLWPLIGWNFQNGWQMDISYAHIYGSSKESGFSTENSIFYYLEDNDIVMWRIIYEY